MLKLSGTECIHVTKDKKEYSEPSERCQGILHYHSGD